MVQRIRDFREGLMRDMGIMIRCKPCGKEVVYRASDFRGYIAPNRVIEHMTWRCAWCHEPSSWVRWVIIDRMPREDLAQWRPPPWMKRQP